MTSKNTKNQPRTNRNATLIIGLVVIMGLVAVLLAMSNAQNKTGADASMTPVAVENPAPLATAVADTPTVEPTPTEVQPEASLPPIGIKIGNRAPDFTLDSLDGELSLSDFKGQVVMINFWATWCGPCRMEMPDVEAMYEKYRDQGFVVLGVNIGETSDTVSKFVDQFELEFPVVLDTKAVVGRQFGAYSIPTSYFLDRQGIIYDARAGALPASLIEQVITSLLDES